MGREKLDAGKPLLERRPQLTKRRRVDHVTPRNTVHVRKHEVATWMTNVIVGTIDDRQTFNAYHCDGTRAIATVICSLEVNGCKRWYVRAEGEMLFSHLVLQRWHSRTR